MELDENKTSLKVERNGREYYFVCDNDSPLGEVFDILCIMKSHIVKSIKDEDEKLSNESEN